MQLRGARRADRVRDNEDQLIPLINIVFLLLIFFMVAGALEPPHPVTVEPPQAALEDEPNRDAGTVYIEHDGSLHVADQPVSLEALAERVEERGGHWVVRADGDAPAARVVAVLRALRDAGLEEAELITRQGEAP